MLSQRPVRMSRADEMTARSSPRRILFVCVENSCRSQMAEAFARIHGEERVEASSAGSRPSGIEAMRELGYDMSAHRSKSVEDLVGDRFDILVSIGCGDECPTVAADRRLEWEIPDPKRLPISEFRLIRDQIDLHVRALLSRDLRADR